jgi:hypothetical protein
MAHAYPVVSASQEEYTLCRDISKASPNALGSAETTG